MPKPTAASEMGAMVNAKRCLVKSEHVAIIMEKTKAHAHGGTENNCVRIGE